MADPGQAEQRIVLSFCPTNPQHNFRAYIAESHNAKNGFNCPIFSTYEIKSETHFPPLKTSFLSWKAHTMY